MLWMQEKMNENLKQVAVKSRRFKNFLKSCSVLAEMLEVFIESELMRFWVWADLEREEGSEDAVDVFKGGDFVG